MIVRKSSVFPASREVVFEKLQRPETLQYIAKPSSGFGQTLFLCPQAEEMDPVAEGERRKSNINGGWTNDSPYDD